MVMNLQDFYPGRLADLSPGRLAREMMQLLLVRTQMVTGSRFALGWRGMAQLAGRGSGSAWTARIRAYQGVFGLQYHRSFSEGDWRGGVFRLAYFPVPEEDLLENVSLGAAAVAHREDYPALIRAFTAYPEMADLFAIGQIHFAVQPFGGAAALGLRARTRDRILARDGVRAVSDGRRISLIPPGGTDQDFPAFAVSYAFFEVLAASLAFNLKAPPSHLVESAGPATERIYDNAGHVSVRPAVDGRESVLWLGYGIDAGASAEPWPPGRPQNGDVLLHQQPVSTSERYPDALWRVAHNTRDIKGLDKQALGIDERPSLIVLTGFLGSGKTSFLRHFIEHETQRSRFVAVIQNEIGAVGLDGKLVAEDVAVTEMDEGCVCCSLIGNLKIAVNRILSEFQPDVIVLETTGLANPFNLLGELEELAEDVRFDSVTTVVDAAEAIATLQRHAVAADQVRAADILLINKLDLVDEETLGALRERLAALNPRAAMVAASQGDVPPGLLYGTDPLEHVRTDAAEEHRHHPKASRPTHRQEGIQSFKLDIAVALEREAFLHAVAEKIPVGVLRIKGILNFRDHPTPFVFQYVGGRWDLTPFTDARVTDRFLVFIGTDLDPAGLQADLLGSRWLAACHA